MAKGQRFRPGCARQPLEAAGRLVAWLNAEDRDQGVHKPANTLVTRMAKII